MPLLGTTEKTATSEYQVMLVNKSDKSLNPMDYPKFNRFFDNEKDRNDFVNLLESSINSVGGTIVHNARASHPIFSSFDIYDKYGELNYELVLYR